MNHFKTSLDQHYWDQRWQKGETGWDIGQASPALMKYAAQITDKSQRILIPGCGNAYEAEALALMGFSDIHILDISPTLTQQLRQRLASYAEVIHIHCGDFFQHRGSYDLILEQTFFCALDPSLREAYVQQCHTLLRSGGRLAGLLFNCQFEQEGPPFGGCEAEYRKLFEGIFTIITMEPCAHSIEPRQGRELFFVVEKA
jgi:SAM-dependent methyltransferase